MKPPAKQQPMPARHHYTASYLLQPTHPVTVNLIGCGGTGSQVLHNLARMHTALKALGHPGLHITAWDGDTITTANIGRQLFTAADVGAYKSVVLVSRINAFYNLAWNAMNKHFAKPAKTQHTNITITCVDSVKARQQIWHELQKCSSYMYLAADYQYPFYWLDFGNNTQKGQAVLGTIFDFNQPKIKGETTVMRLPNIFDLHPDFHKEDRKKNEPSCSLAEALDKQDLFINPTLANLGCDILWKLFREMRVKHHGIYLNLETMTTNPIKV